MHEKIRTYKIIFKWNITCTCISHYWYMYNWFLCKGNLLIQLYFRVKIWIFLYIFIQISSSINDHTFSHLNRFLGCNLLPIYLKWYLFISQRWSHFTEFFIFINLTKYIYLAKYLINGNPTVVYWSRQSKYWSG